MRTTKKNTLYAPGVFFVLLALLAHPTDAQPAKEATELARADVREPVPDSDAQRRRALLRASLKAQSESHSAQAATAHPLRPLSAQERADLRQQLRQQ